MFSTSGHMDNFTRARLNMIESQIRAGGVTNPRVIAAMADLPRENFVPLERGILAYAETDAAVSVGDGFQPVRYLLAPPLLARLVDAAGIHEGDLVLDIGCASGYSTAILAQLVGMGTVVGLEEDKALAEQASSMLERLDLDNTVIINHPLDKGYLAQGPYNVILLNGAAARPPEDLAELFADQLCDGGRCVGVFDDGGDIKGYAWLLTKNGAQICCENLFDARAPILPGFEAPAVGFRFPGLAKKSPQKKSSQTPEAVMPAADGDKKAEGLTKKESETSALPDKSLNAEPLEAKKPEAPSPSPPEKPLNEKPLDEKPLNEKLAEMKKPETSAPNVSQFSVSKPSVSKSPESKSQKAEVPKNIPAKIPETIIDSHSKAHKALEEKKPSPQSSEAAQAAKPASADVQQKGKT